MSHSSVDLIKKLYRNICDLKHYLNSVGYDLQNEDEGFVSFLEKFLVANNSNLRPPKIGEKCSKYEDIVLQYIQSQIRRSKSSNVLALGIHSRSENTRGLSKSGFNMSVPVDSPVSFYQLQSLSGENWRRFHQIVGDECLHFLLKNNTIFRQCSDGSLVQISGVVVTDLIKKLTPEQCFLAGESNSAKWIKNLLPGKSSAENLDVAFADEKSIERESGRNRKRNASDELEMKAPPSKLRCSREDNMAPVELKSNGMPGTASKKRTRRGRRRKPTVSESTVSRSSDKNPYYYRLVIKQTVYFHSKNYRERIPPSHFLNSCSGQELFNAISKLNVSHNDGKDSEKSNHLKKGNVWLLLNQRRQLRRIQDNTPIPKKFNKAVEILGLVVRNHRKFIKKAKHLVEYHCPVLPTKQLKTLTTAQLFELFSPVRRVWKFIRRALCLVLPKEFFGSSRNKNHFLEFLLSLFELGQSEKTCLGMLMDRIRTKDFEWAQGLTSVDRQKFGAQFLVWALNYCFNLVKSFFYVTTASNLKNRPLFYRKQLWRELHRRGIADIIGKGLFKPISKSDVEEMIKNGLALGYSPLRLLPKKTSMRPIAHLGWKPKVGNLSGLSINQTLNTSFLILQDICKQNPEFLGFGMWRLDEFRDRYVSFITRRNSNLKFYYVKADIKDCYDSINKIKLVKILHRIFEKAKNEYNLKRYASMSEVCQKLCTRYHRVVGDDHFPKCAKSRPRSSVLVEQREYSPKIGISEAMETIQCHLLCNILNALGVFYHQIQGISQGSVLSSLLCNVYCGAFENEFIKISENELLVRQMDDYLFLTPSRRNARTFLHILIEGKEDYNLYINAQKTIVNFDCMDLPRDRRPVTTNSMVVKWCGMVLDLNSLCVSPDYWRYHGLNIDDAISAEYILHPGLAMKRKLLSSVKNKMLAVYYDRRLVSLTSVVTNLFDVGLFAAFVFCSLCRKLNKFHRAVHNDAFLLSVLNSVPTRMNRIIRTHSTDSENPASENLYPSVFEIRFIAFSAFEQKIGELGNKNLVNGLKNLKKIAQKKIAANRLELLHFNRQQLETGPFAFIL